MSSFNIHIDHVVQYREQQVHSWKVYDPLYPVSYDINISLVDNIDSNDSCWRLCIGFHITNPESIFDVEVHEINLIESCDQGNDECLSVKKNANLPRRLHDGITYTTFYASPMAYLKLSLNRTVVVRAHINSIRS